MPTPKTKRKPKAKTKPPAQPALFQATQTTIPIKINAPRKKHPSGTGYLPAWVANQLQDNKDNRAARTARYHKCDKCKEIIITGLDADIMAFTVTVDPTPLDPHKELACIMANRYTFTAWPTIEGYHLEHRDMFNMSDQQHPVLPAHRCGARFPGFLEAPSEGRTHDWATRPDF